MYSNTTDLIQLLKKHNLWTQKKLGQNFLINPEIIKKIIAAAQITKDDYVLEVGPGMGILTTALAEHAGKVKTIEFDQRLIPILQENFSTQPHVEIELNDALKTDLPKEPYKLVANIPYYITSPLLNHFLQPTHGANEESAMRAPSQGEVSSSSRCDPAPSRPSNKLSRSDSTHEAERSAPMSKMGLRPSLIVLLVQKEVAQKICAEKDDQSILSLQVQIFGKPTIVDYVGKNNFFPAPQVDSAVIKIETYPEPLIQDTTTFFRLIKAAFSQKRKTLLNSLKSGLTISKDDIITMLKTTNIDPTRRPQTLTIEEWNKLILNLQKN